LELTFSIEVENFGEKIDHELKPGGAHIMVTEENREEYVKLFVEYTFN
jgi:copper(I)-binding protein